MLPDERSHVPKYPMKVIATRKGKSDGFESRDPIIQKTFG